MWPFGRKREPADETRCASCGRTLLAGEWTQRMIADDGSEMLLCSLCSQSRSGRSAPVEAAMPDGDQSLPTNGRDNKRRSDAFWLALKEKDAEIEDLRTRLARSETEKEELLAELVVLRGASGAGPEALEPGDGGVAPDAAPELEAVAGGALDSTSEGDGGALDSTSAPDAVAALEEASDPDAAVTLDAEAAAAESTAAPAEDETTEAESIAAPAEDEAAPVVAEVAAAGVAAEESPEPPADEAREGDLEDTLPGTLSSDEILAAESAAAGVPGVGVAAADEGAHAWPPDTDTADDYLTDAELHLVQRGVDILNVSAVPKKIAETNASLGVPFVHVAVEPDASISVTYVWPLGWYRFSVLGEGSGSVSLAERGYEELTELQANGTVRSDGTVQLSPTFGKRPTPKEETAADVEPSVSTASVTSGVIISKSLMGQRTDDEAVVPWENQNARDFDWGR